MSVWVTIMNARYDKVMCEIRHLQIYTQQKEMNGAFGRSIHYSNMMMSKWGASLLMKHDAIFLISKLYPEMNAKFVVLSIDLLKINNVKFNKESNLI